MAKIMGLNEKYCPVITAAKNFGILDNNIDGSIKILGDRIGEVKVLDFKLLKGIGREDLIENEFIKKIFLPFVRNSLNLYPVVNYQKCDLCKTCMKVCLEGSISVENQKINFNYENCSRCFCCSEMCPQGAIETKYSFLGKLIMEKLAWAGRSEKLE